MSTLNASSFIPYGIKVQYDIHTLVLIRNSTTGDWGNLVTSIVVRGNRSVGEKRCLEQPLSVVNDIYRQLDQESAPDICKKKNYVSFLHDYKSSQKNLAPARHYKCLF